MKYQSLSPNIGVENVNETVKFYTETLGFNLVMSNPPSGDLEWAMIANGNAVVMFQKIESLKKEYLQLKDRTALGVITFYVKMKNMHELYERLKNTHFLAQDMHKTFYGADEFAIFDNNGNILTITEDAEDETTFLSYDNYFLPVDDYEESKRFYSETLGLKKKFEFDAQGMVAFEVGNEEPAIILKDKKKFPNLKPTVWIVVEDVKTIYKEMKKRGVNFLTEPFRIRTGWAVEFEDLSGNRLGITDYKSE